MMTASKICIFHKASVVCQQLLFLSSWLMQFCFWQVCARFLLKLWQNKFWKTTWDLLTNCTWIFIWNPDVGEAGEQFGTDEEWKGKRVSTSLLTTPTSDSFIILSYSLLKPLLKLKKAIKTFKYISDRKLAREASGPLYIKSERGL